LRGAAVALARFDELTLEDLPSASAVIADRFVMTADEVEEIISLDELERRYIGRALKLLNGNKARAAQLLGAIAGRCTAPGRYATLAASRGPTGPAATRSQRQL
jgi:hypothetical protein